MLRDRCTRTASLVRLWNIVGVLCFTSWLAPAQADDSEDAAKRFEGFEKAMSGVVLDGQFTILGRDQDALPRETYEIARVQKLPQGDYWQFQARIKYADKDVTLPLPLEVKWAGKTPVITLDDLAIPGLGTFSARVVIDGDKYAGTWTHGQAGGHLFGTIRPKQSTAKPNAASEE
jgi:hypothetical protein